MHKAQERPWMDGWMAHAGRSIRLLTVIALSSALLATAAPIAWAGGPPLDAWGIDLVGSQSVSGQNTYLYRQKCHDTGTRCPRFRGIVQPDLAGECLNFDLEKQVNGAWVNASGWDATKCYMMVSGGDPDVSYSKALAIYQYDGLHKTLGHYRVRMLYPSGQSHMAAQSGWLKFRVIR